MKLAQFSFQVAEVTKQIWQTKVFKPGNLDMDDFLIIFAKMVDAMMDKAKAEPGHDWKVDVSCWEEDLEGVELAQRILEGTCKSCGAPRAHDGRFTGHSYQCVLMRKAYAEWLWKRLGTAKPIPQVKISDGNGAYIEIVPNPPKIEKVNIPQKDARMEL